MQKLIHILKERRRGILFVLKMISSELWDWKPEQSMKTTAQLAYHLASAPLSLFKGLQSQISNKKTALNPEIENIPSSVQGLTDLYEQGLLKLISFLEEHLEDAHELKIQFFYQKQPSSIYKEVFDEIGHEWFHLGQLFTYLKQNRIPIDMGTYYGYEDPDPNIPPNE
ncbi:MAG: DinB family protein [Promethearchaeota archaeon]